MRGVGPVCRKGYLPHEYCGPFRLESYRGLALGVLLSWASFQSEGGGLGCPLSRVLDVRAV